MINWDSFIDFEKLSRGSALERIKNNPVKYSLAQVYRKIYFPLSKRSLILECKLFWGDRFFVWLPSGFDIFLTGGKTHDSELRLAKFLLLHCKKDWICIDVGAHFGYYSLLLATLATEGEVHAFEPSTAAFKMLKRNTEPFKNIRIYNVPLGEREGVSEFFEYPIQYSEYNSSSDEQYKDDSWRAAAEVEKKILQTTTLDLFCQRESITPQFVKIDVEGGELALLSGASNLLQGNTIFAMEFLGNKRRNEVHLNAHHLFIKNGYIVNRINEEGNLETINDPLAYVSSTGLESDNLVYTKALNS